MKTSYVFQDKVTGKLIVVVEAGDRGTAIDIFNKCVGDYREVVRIHNVKHISLADVEVKQ